MSRTADVVAAPPGSARVRRYLRNAIPVGVAGVVSLAMSALGMALLLRFLGPDRVGFVYFMNATALTIVGVTGANLTTASVHRISQAYPAGDLSAVRQAMGVNILASACVAAVLFLVGEALARWVVPFARLPPVLLREAGASYALFIAQVACVQVSAAYQVVPYALQRLDAASVVTAVFSVVTFVVPIGAVLIHPTLPTYAWAAASVAAVRVVADAYLARRLFGEWLLPRWSGPEFSRLRGFAGWVYLNSVFSTLSGMADKFVITGFVGAGQLAYYGTAQRLMSLVHGSLYNITQVLFPTFAELGKSLGDAVRRHGDAVAWVLGMVVGLAYCCELAVAPWLLGRMVNPQFLHQAWPYVLMATLYGLALGFGLLPWYLSLGAGQPHINTLMGIGYAIVSIPLLLVCVGRYGAFGASLVSLLMVANTVIQSYWIRHNLLAQDGERPWLAVGRALKPFLVPALFGAGTTALAAWLVLAAHTGMVAYTLVILLAGAAGLGVSVIVERRRASDRYDLLLHFVRGGLGFVRRPQESLAAAGPRSGL